MASPGTMLTRAICPVAWGSEVMIAGFPTIACRRLNAIVSRLQVGDCVDASILLAKDCPRWRSSAYYILERTHIGTALWPKYMLSESRCMEPEGC